MKNDMRVFWTDDPAVGRLEKQIETLVGATARNAVREYMRESCLFVECNGKNDINVSISVFASDLLASKRFNLSRVILDSAIGNKDQAHDLARKLRKLADRIEKKCG